MSAQRALAALIFLLAISEVPGRVHASNQSQSAEPAGDWFTYSGSYRSERYSALTQIAAANVTRLQ
jgi:glucose dehydrogenase